MALDGLMIHQINQNLQSLLPAKINKIQTLSQTEILFTIRSLNQNHKLLISAHSVYNRINLTNHNYTALDEPGNFAMVLRKHIDGGHILSIDQIGLDRILHFTIQVRDEIGDMKVNHLYVELMGKYANIILVNNDNIIIDALKRIPPYENSKRLILPQAKFVLPQAHVDKRNPFIESTFNEDISLLKQFHGISPLFTSEIQYRLAQGESFKDVMKQVLNSDKLYMTELNQQSYAHVIPLTHLLQHNQGYELMQGIDTLYYEQEEKERIKQQSGDLFKCVRHNLHKNESKLPKLEKTLMESMDCDKYREYGDLLFAYMHKIDRQVAQVILPSFEDGEDVKIPLNIKLDVKGNANKYYQKYHKSKRAQIIVKEQIEQAQKEYEYFEMITMQLAQASLEDAQEIRQELVKNGYMREKQARNHKKKKKINLPHYDTFNFEDGQIFVGKNNIQNDYLTFHFAHKEDLWFHIKGYHGSHVILRCDEPSETLIRNAALLAAWYSQGRQSSSIPIDYCPLKEIKKIPGSKLGLVSMNKYKTIYIDPDKYIIQSLIDQYRTTKKG